MFCNCSIINERLEDKCGMIHKTNNLPEINNMEKKTKRMES